MDSPGFIWQSSSTFDSQSAVGTLTVNQAVEMAVVSQGIIGTKTNVLAQIQPRSNAAGWLYQTFSTLYYNHIHFTPNPLAFGNVVTPTTRSVEVWNAFFTSKTLNGVTPETLEGVSIDEDMFPYVFDALQAIDFNATATLDGPPSIAGNFIFNFADLDATLPVTGTRSLIFAFKHNWDSRPVERIAFLTEILPGQSGKEQRIRHRQNPRRTWEYSYLPSDAHQRALFRAQLWQGQPYRFSVPFWPDVRYLAAQLNAGATVIPLATAYLDYDAGGTVLLMTDAFTYEAIEIDSVAPGQLNLSNPTAQTWRAGAMVVPLRQATLPPEISYSEITATINRGESLPWQVVPTEVSVNRLTLPTITNYRGIPVFERWTEASEDIKEDLARKEDVIDFGHGVIRVFPIAARPQPTFDFRWLGKSKAELSAILGWLYTFVGRLNPVWVPTWCHDFVLAQNIGAADTSIKVTDWGYRTFYNLADTRRDIAIIKTDGTFIRRRITAVAATAGNSETLTLDSAVGVALTIAQVDRVCFLRCGRLAIDEVEIPYEVSEVGLVVLRFTELTTAP